jgi:hypothetical protein
LGQLVLQHLDRSLVARSVGYETDDGSCGGGDQRTMGAYDHCQLIHTRQAIEMELCNSGIENSIILDFVLDVVLDRLNRTRLMPELTPAIPYFIN